MKQPEYIEGQSSARQLQAICGRNFTGSAQEKKAGTSELMSVDACPPVHLNFLGVHRTVHRVSPSNDAGFHVIRYGLF